MKVLLIVTTAVLSLVATSASAQYQFSGYGSSIYTPANASAATAPKAYNAPQPSYGLRAKLKGQPLTIFAKSVTKPGSATANGRGR